MAWGQAPQVIRVPPDGPAMRALAMRAGRPYVINNRNYVPTYSYAPLYPPVVKVYNINVEVVNKYQTNQYKIQQNNYNVIQTISR
jgi:hypothetical protein